MRFRRNTLARALLLPAALISALLPACRKPPPPLPAPPPPSVTIARPVDLEVMEWDVYSGRLEAVESVEVRPRVSGMIVATPFKEGAIVNAGDLLFEIDRRPFEAELASKQADADRADAELQLAQIEYRRIEAVPPSSRSQTELDAAAATVKQTQAQLDAAKAMAERARLNLEWCRVTAPISGRVGRAFIRVGNLVTGEGGQATLLTTIQSIDPIYCYVDVDERSVLKYQRLAREKRRPTARENQIPCQLELANETGFPHHGYVDFVDNRVDVTTGTIWGRGVFPNPHGWLTPGFFARMRVPGTAPYQAILIPDGAVVTDQNAKSVMVVDENNTVQMRHVELGALFGDLRAVVSGVSVDDRVIINGLVHARPGAVVNPQEGSFSLDGLPPIAYDIHLNEQSPASAPASAAGFLVPTAIRNTP